MKRRLSNHQNCLLTEAFTFPAASALELSEWSGLSPKSVYRIALRWKQQHVSTLPPVPMQHDEIPLKQWIAEQAQRQNLTARAVQARFNRGKYPHLKLRRVNQRVVFVQNQSLQPPF